MRKLLILLPFLILNSYSCDEVNFYQTRPEIFDEPVKNQADMSTCYAHSLSTLYNLEIAKSSEEKINTYWIAYNHKKRIIHWQPRDLNYSVLSWAFSDLKKAGRCDASINKSILDDLKNGASYSDDQLMYVLKSYFKKKSFKMINPSYNFSEIINETYVYLKENSNGFEIAWNIEDVSNILNSIEKQSRFTDLFGFLKKRFSKCSDNTSRVYGDLKSFGRGFESNKKLKRKIRNILNNNSAIGIGYCPNVVYEVDPNTSKDIKIIPRIAKSFTKKCGAHYSVVVGSRKMNNRCQYLVRNTYNTNYWAHKNVKCWCKDNSSQKQFNCSSLSFDPKNQKVLGCWFDSDKLLNNTYDLSFFR
jgi:hypothetical protein